MAVACALSHSRCHYHSLPRPNPTCSVYSSFPPPTIKSQNPSLRSNCFIFSTNPLQTIPRSLPNDHSRKLSQSDVRESLSSNSDDLPKQLDAISDSAGSLKVFGLDALGLEIISIALPAALALAADPLASLVDTAFVGHLGSVELAAVGVSASVFNLVSKLFNVPLLNVTTSFVAQEQAIFTNDPNESTVYGVVSDHKRKILLPSISTSLVLATGLGIAETVALSVGSGFLMNTMGIPADSPMRMPAEQFLTLRSFGAPPIVIALAAQGTFRGFKDTKTPLYAVGAGNILNVVLDLILIFCFNLGIAGAAIATVTSEYVNDVVFNSSDLVIEVKRQSTTYHSKN